MRSQYWSCTKLANLIRGTPKPHAASIEEWDEWHERAKLAHPYRYWIAEDLLDSLQKFVNFIPDTVTETLYYINNRWVSKTHYMKTGLKPGDWYDYDTRIINATFNELVNFVEIECAWHNLRWNKKEFNLYSVPWWVKHRVYRDWKCPDSGLAYLKWSSELMCDESNGYTVDDENYGKPMEQAISANKILELYNWWTVVRPKRPDPHEISGWNEYCNTTSFSFRFSKDDEDRQHTRKMLASIHEIEAMYEKEDTEMLIELIKIRHHLWT